MKRYIVTSAVLLILSLACEEKKKTVRRPAAPVPEPTEVTSSPEINLPSVEISKPETKETETIALAAKTLPPQTVKYEDVTTRDLAEGSANEMKDESLARIREKALARAKELEDEQAKAEALSQPTDGTKVAKVEPSSAEAPEETESSTPAAELPLDAPLEFKQNLDKKTSRSLDLQFAAAVAKVKAGRLDEARNAFLTICQSGHAHACHKFAWYEASAGNDSNATRFYRAACDNGLGKSCNNLAFQFEQKKNYDKAMELYAKGCMGKHEASCVSLKRLRDEQKSEGLIAR